MIRLINLLNWYDLSRTKPNSRVKSIPTLRREVVLAKRLTVPVVWNRQVARDRSGLQGWREKSVLGLGDRPLVRSSSVGLPLMYLRPFLQEHNSTSALGNWSQMP